MKEVIMVRHAKSSWRDFSISDAERPLNDRGKADAPFMAALLAEKYPSLDLIVSSHAKRAHTTAKHFAKAYFKKKDEIVTNPQLYHSDIADILHVIRSMSDEASRIALFGHNPGWTFFANMIPDVRIDNIPTCGIAVIRSEVDNWKEFDIEQSILVNFFYPKQFNRNV